MTRAIVAEFYKDSSKRLWLFQVTIVKEETARDGRRRDMYDVEHSRRYGYIFHLSGFGGDPARAKVTGPYFTSGDNRTRRLRALPKAFDLPPGGDLLDWLQHNAIEEKSVWCSTCRDSFPESSSCGHVWWCEKGSWSTPSDRCECGTAEACRKCPHA